MTKKAITILTLFSLASCNWGHTSSKDRFETTCRIKLPADTKVIKEEYQDMGQDYCILYNLQLTENSTKEFVKSIKSSIYYNSKVTHNGVFLDAFFVDVDSTKSAWCKSQKGYIFHRDQGLTDYWAWFDTLTKQVSYQECAD